MKCPSLHPGTQGVYWKLELEPVEGQTFVEASIWTVAQTDQGNVVLVRPKGSDLAVPIFIGQLETQSILIGLGGVEVPRPLTHDLLLSVVAELGARLDRVEIHDLQEGTFYARLVLAFEGGKIELDARPSDAIALAVRTACPVFIAESVVEEAGISVNLVAGLQGDTGERPILGTSILDGEVVSPARAAENAAVNLRVELEKAVAAEDYERAAAIRDRLKELGSASA